MSMCSTPPDGRADHCASCAPIALRTAAARAVTASVRCSATSGWFARTQVHHLADRAEGALLRPGREPALGRGRDPVAQVAERRTPRPLLDGLEEPERLGRRLAARRSRPHRRPRRSQRPPQRRVGLEAHPQPAVAQGRAGHGAAAQRARAARAPGVRTRRSARARRRSARAPCRHARPAGGPATGRTRRRTRSTTSGSSAGGTRERVLGRRRRPARRSRSAPSTPTGSVAR